MGDVETPNPSSRKSDLFISYSRRDKTFVQALEAMFRSVGREPWIDWDDRYEGNARRTAIALGILEADTFIVVISPDSVRSQACAQELDQAIRLNKRIVAIVRRDPINDTALPPVLAELNWIFFRETDDFELAFKKLMQALDADLPHAQTHTRLLGQAVEWENGRDDSGLLRGQDLARAEQWLVEAVSQVPPPTELHRKYIAKSREVESANQRVMGAGRKAQRILYASAGGAIVTLALAAITAAVLVGHANQRVAESSHQVQALKQNAARLSSEITSNQKKMEQLKTLQQQLSQDPAVLTPQLKQFGFTDAAIQALLAQPGAVVADRLEQIQQANRNYQAAVQQWSRSRQLAAGQAPSPTRWVTLEYSPKGVDPRVVQQSLKALGFNLKLLAPTAADTPTNTLWYGKTIEREEVQGVAYTLIRAGIQIKSMQPLAASADPKGGVIQAGALRPLKPKPPLTVEEIRSQPLPLPRPQ